jgi:hypothetical protein
LVFLELLACEAQMIHSLSLTAFALLIMAFAACELVLSHIFGSLFWKFFALRVNSTIVRLSLLLFSSCFAISALHYALLCLTISAINLLFITGAVNALGTRLTPTGNTLYWLGCATWWGFVSLLLLRSLIVTRWFRCLISLLILLSLIITRWFGCSLVLT